MGRLSYKNSHGTFFRWIWSLTITLILEFYYMANGLNVKILGKRYTTSNPTFLLIRDAQWTKNPYKKNL